MNRFSDYLIELNGKLDLSQPTRSRVILEIAGDLEGLYEHFRSQGQDDQQARQLAIERLALDQEQITSLQELHQSGANRWLDRFARFRIDIWERFILGLMLALILVLVARQITAADLFENSNGFIWPVLILALIGLGLVINRIYALLVKKDYRPRYLRRGLVALPALAIGSLSVGLLGTILDVFVTANRMVMNRDLIGYHFMHSLLRVSALNVFSLLVTISLALAWFLLLTKVVKIEQAEVAFLLEDN